MMQTLYNGILYPVNKAPIPLNNRAFKYGDGVFETIRCKGLFPLHFQLHYKRLVAALKALKMDVSSLPIYEEMEAQIKKLLQKNLLFKASRVRISCFRDGEGLYTPTSNKINYYIESSVLESVDYELNSKGLLIDTYTDIKKELNPISFFKISSALTYVMAAIHKQENNLDDCLIVNSQGLIIEAISSNVYYLKGEIIYTPKILSGCVAGVMRQVMFQFVTQSGAYQLEEVAGITEDDLLNADECFITNAIQGMQWVVGFKDKRYFNNQTRLLHQQLGAYILEITS